MTGSEHLQRHIRVVRALWDFESGRSAAILLTSLVEIRQ
jgi:hypothetical protein